jgi:hypothetical protein
MKRKRVRRTFHVYVVELDRAVLENRRFRDANPDRHPDGDCFYVGMTGLSPERRFENHKRNIKAGRGWVRDFGLHLRPDLYEDLNPMTRAEAEFQEEELPRLLRQEGHAVMQH